jgi:hypothetical protein
MVVNILWVFINVMRVKAVVVNLSSSKCSISCVCSEVFLRSYNVRLSRSFLYVYALELNAVAYLAGFVCKVFLKEHKCVLCKHLLLKCNTDYLNVKSEAFCILSFVSIARRIACTHHLMLF